MKKLSLMSLPLLLIMASLCTIVSAAAPVYINNVGLMPDWQQPNAPLPFGNLPGYSNWCSPTAVANAFGWWEDAKSAVGLTDRLLFNATTAAPLGIPPTLAGQWKERLWQDRTVELGWFMNTGGWQTNNPKIPRRSRDANGANRSQRCSLRQGRVG
jgi:hypothetical protein